MAQTEDKIYLITGANTGIGKATALGLAKTRGMVLLLCRNERKGEKAKEEIVRLTGNEQVYLYIMDLASFKSVRNTAQEMKKRFNKIDVLVNNAAAFYTSFALTDDGFERQFQVNHLSGFLLTLLLLDHVKAADDGRIINVSSKGNYKGAIHFEDLNLEKNYNGLKAYRQSKLANVLFTYELARRLSDSKVTVNTLHPGVVGTQIGYANNRRLPALVWWLGRHFMINDEQGAETTLYLALSEEISGVTGKYFDKCKPKRSADKSYDLALAQKLWDISEEYVGL
ncbi:MAG: SDR family oxidoreductase [Bacteroidota bacterium]